MKPTVRLLLLAGVMALQVWQAERGLFLQAQQQHRERHALDGHELELRVTP